MEKNKDNMETCFYELYTEYGTLYFYEYHDHSTDATGFYKYGPMYEFFTGKEIVYTYDSITFEDDDVSFETCHRFQGIINERYYKKLSAYEFFLKIAPYISNNQDRQDKIDSVNKIIDLKRNNNPNYLKIMDCGQINEDFKNEVSLKLLKPYMK